MTDLPTPKFRIGQIVYQPHLVDAKERLPCPDCLGTGKWTATSPAGVVHEMGCPRCGGHYIIDHVPPLTIFRKQPAVHRFTIGSVRIDTADHRGRFVQYICSETGIGTGSIYDEINLFDTEESAISDAMAQAAVENAKIDANPKVIEARRFSGQLIADALRDMGRASTFRAWSSARLYRNVIIDHIPEQEDGSRDNDIERDLRWSMMSVDKYADENFLDALNPVDELVGSLRKLAAIVGTVESAIVATELARFDERTAAVFATVPTKRPESER